MSNGKRILNFLHALCFPPKCTACHKLLDWRLPRDCADVWEEALCEDCLRAWKSETLETCGNCAMRVCDCVCQPQLMHDAKCEGLCKAVYYLPRQSAPVQNRIIFSMKRRADRKTAGFAARELSYSVERFLHTKKISRDALIVTHLPRSRRSVLQYGTDQAYELARALAKRLGVPHETLILRKRNANRTQKELSERERKENAKQSFLAHGGKDCKGKTVLLVDDVVTTGAGMAVCARILKKMGASSVIGVTFAVDAENKDD